MMTTLVDSVDGRRWEVDDLPILAKGVLLSLAGAFAARRVTDVHLHLDHEGRLSGQVLILGTSGE
jgi:hypothetical protein